MQTLQWLLLGNSKIYKAYQWLWLSTCRQQCNCWISVYHGTFCASACKPYLERCHLRRKIWNKTRDLLNIYAISSTNSNRPDLWFSDLNINRGNTVVNDCLPIKYGASGQSILESSVAQGFGNQSTRAKQYAITLSLLTALWKYQELINLYIFDNSINDSFVFISFSLYASFVVR